MAFQVAHPLPPACILGLSRLPPPRTRGPSSGQMMTPTPTWYIPVFRDLGPSFAEKQLLT
jgi:hypothetical protein